MLYVINSGIAIALFVLAFVFLRKLIKGRASDKMKRKGVALPALVGGCIAVLSFFLLPFLEGVALSYSSPQAAYQANHFGQIDAVAEGVHSTLVVSQKGGANSAITILPKNGDMWKIASGLETKLVGSTVVGSPKALVSLYRYAGSSDYYLVANTIDLESQEIEVADSENTSFTHWERNAPAGTFYFCCASLNRLDQDYTLYVNGEAIVFS